MTDQTNQTTTPWTPREQLPVEMARALQEAGAWEGRGLRAGDWVQISNRSGSEAKNVLVADDAQPGDRDVEVHKYVMSLETGGGGFRRCGPHARELTLFLPSLADLLQAIRRQGWHARYRDCYRDNAQLVWAECMDTTETTAYVERPSELVATAECLLQILRAQEGQTDV